jgi:hypothetical protein
MSTQREQSKKDWTGQSTIEAINSGSLQRIADATEKMAQSYTDMERSRNYFKGLYEERKSSIMLLRRSDAALRGVITKLKSAKETK